MTAAIPPAPRGGPHTPTTDGVTVLPAGRELDAIVAERVMGWERGRPERGDMPWRPLGARRGAGVMQVPRFSTDIAAAYAVVEHLRRLDWLVLVLSGHRENRCACVLARGFAAPFPVEDVVLHGDVYLDDSIRVQAETESLAICRAALMAITPAPPARPGDPHTTTA